MTDRTPLDVPVAGTAAASLARSTRCAEHGAGIGEPCWTSGAICADRWRSANALARRAAATRAIRAGERVPHEY